MADAKPRNFWERVSEFVKHPTQDWALTRHANAAREQQERERVRARDEQRRLDAFVRKRELAALRRLRKRQADGLPLDGIPSDVPDTGSGPSPVLPAREATLRKINEIEQAMSGGEVRPSRPQHATSAPSRDEREAIRVGGAHASPASMPATRDAAGHRTEPLASPVADLRKRQEHGKASVDAPSRSGDIAATVQAASRMAPTQIVSTVPQATLLAPLAMRQPPGDSWIRSAMPASPIASLAVDVQEGVSSSPLFDQACIDFANGQDESAERALLDAISGSPDRELENEFWLALFDLYRASNNAVRFEALVADYVDRFQSSAPSWDTAAGRTAAAPRRATNAQTGSTASFTALGEIDAPQARTLLLLARSGAPQVLLDFNALTTIEAGAETLMYEALKGLNAASGCAIELGGLDNLTDACLVAAAPMQRDAAPSWWHLRLEALRMAGNQDAFENAAMDYCVTYEMSPPAWDPPRARVRVIAPDLGAATQVGAERTGPATRATPDTRIPTGFSANTTTGIVQARLTGEIQGGREDFLRPLDKAVTGRTGIIVNLAELRRLDFASAGIILNWVMTQNTAGRLVRFEGTHRLIAGLFVILGINSVAQIELRRA